jgi:hypothetical protein
VVEETHHHRAADGIRLVAHTEGAAMTNLKMCVAISEDFARTADSPEIQRALIIEFDQARKALARYIVEWKREQEEEN